MNTQKALVVGGAGGLGAAVVRALLERGYEAVYVADKNEPTAGDERVHYLPLNLTQADFDVLMPLVDELDTLVITAGVGRVTFQQDVSEAELDTSFAINAVAPIKILRLFYERLLDERAFYCGVVTSIAAHVASPLYAAYSATKAALHRYVEAINAELAVQGKPNRILELAPGRLEGTRFHGQAQDQLELVMPVAENMLEQMYARQSLLIPDYEETYREVLERYHRDAESFGVESARYKLEGSGVEPESKTCVGYITGCFDLFHVGHLNILQRAKQMCDYLVVGVHTDASHKGKTLVIPLEERMRIVGSVDCVDEVIECSSADIDDYPRVHFNRLFVGDDYKGTERFKQFEEFLTPLGVEIVYLPYTKGTSSTQLREFIKTH